MRRVVFATAVLLAACGGDGDAAEPFNEETLRAYIEENALADASQADIEDMVSRIRGLCDGPAFDRYIQVHTGPDGFDEDYFAERFAEMFEIACPDALIEDE